ncbi:hypothetical protein K474DRAFT_1773629, partial [Panus rudis PR-1116 ss-1]
KDKIDSAFRAGSTRCANQSQNSKHGASLGQFYKNSLKNENSAALYIGFKDKKQGPLGDKIKKDGKDKACPDQKSGIYRHPTDPSSRAQCPARTSKRDNIPERFRVKRSDAELVARFVTTETGITGILPYRRGDNNSHAEVGRAVWTTNGEGDLIRDIIVSSEEL